MSYSLIIERQIMYVFCYSEGKKRGLTRYQVEK